MENDTLLTGENAAFLDAQYEAWLRSPESVDEAWRSLFETWGRPILILDPPKPLAFACSASSTSACVSICSQPPSVV